MTQRTRFDVIREDGTITKPVSKKYPVVCQQWEESERGWGCRPDGYSLHLTEADREAYVKDYWDREKKLNPSGEAPDEYERPCGTPYIVDVSQEVYDKIDATKNGLRCSGQAPKGAKNGWVPLK